MTKHPSPRRRPPDAVPADARPPMAVAHVFLPATAVRAAADWLETIGLRPIFAGDELAILELRGGTHVIITPADAPPEKGSEAPFDLMVDDVAATRRALAAKGLKPSRIRQGRVHASFGLASPDGQVFTILSSHADDRPV